MGPQAVAQSEYARTQLNAPFELGCPTSTLPPPHKKTPKAARKCAPPTAHPPTPMTPTTKPPPPNLSPTPGLTPIPFGSHRYNTVTNPFADNVKAGIPALYHRYALTLCPHYGLCWAGVESLD